MPADIIEKHCFVESNAKLQAAIRFKTSYYFLEHF